MNLQKLTKSIYISDQITTDDIDKLVTIGIKTIVNNRPDYEENNQPLSKELEAYANNCGLIYYFIPIIPAQYTPDKIAEFTDVLAKAQTPIAVFCRTGNRSSTLWALSQKEQCDAKYIINQAKLIGFNVEGVFS